ncbi:hypothetical protein Q1695_005406 [Nippostrongylus brasiliensis]|nr:hypothetical protein Q1695_005406 [Nippostrongylus brasiliensis]
MENIFSQYPVTVYSRTTTPRPPTAAAWDQRRAPDHRTRTVAPPPWWETTPRPGAHHSNPQQHLSTQNQADLHYRPLYEQQVRTTPSYYYYYTTAAPRWDPRTYPTTPPQSVQYGYTNNPYDNRNRPVDDQRYSPNSKWSLRQTQQVSIGVVLVRLAKMRGGR